MNKSVLMIAYHFPPVGVSSGVHRTLNFVKDLTRLGWQPLLLTVNPRAYERTNPQQLDDVPASVIVKRAFGLDTSRHLAVAGRYPSWLALPDRWVSWWVGGVWSGWRLCRRHRPSVIWVTYPITTALLIALTLHKLTRLPLIIDLRDSMVDETYPAEPIKRRLYQWIENRVVRSARYAVVTTESTKRLYSERYPNIDSARWQLIPNGYDEAAFAEIEGAAIFRERDQRRVFLHSGLLNPADRDPTAFFEALASLKKRSVVSAQSIRVVLRATGHDDEYAKLLADLKIEDIVVLAPPYGYKDALCEMVDADALLIFQGTTCNHQIPAKLYEYFRAAKPIFAMTDIDGDTARTLRDAGIDTIVPMDSPTAIADGFSQFLAGLEAGNLVIASKTAVKTSSRQYAAEFLAKLLESV